mmetsp:Transcript_61372/g.155884  ORF Transcript_61372/g.155884 Transcript_61372/m.155884 type:complete len:237 (-) Transcript_61372:959-1669(-)
MALVDRTVEGWVGQGIPLVAAHLDAGNQAQAFRPWADSALNECSRLQRLCVEILEHCSRCRHSLLRGLGICDSGFVLGLLLGPDAGGLVCGLLDGHKLLLELRCSLRELKNRGLAVVDCGGQCVDILGELVACDLALSHLSITKSLMLGILLGLLHQACDHAVDHFLHFREWIRRHFLCQQSEGLALEPLALRGDEVADTAANAHRALHRRAARCALQEGGRRNGLGEGEVLLGAA